MPTMPWLRPAEAPELAERPVDVGSAPVMPFNSAGEKQGVLGRSLHRGSPLGLPAVASADPPVFGGPSSGSTIVVQATLAAGATVPWPFTVTDTDDPTYSVDCGSFIDPYPYPIGTTQVDCTATSAGGTTMYTFSVQVVQSAPVNTAPPLVSGSPQQGQQLTATPGSWTGSPTPSYSYQWQRCDNSGLNCTDIASATTNSYTPLLADVGSTLLVQVTASNTAGTTGPIASTPTSSISPANSAPVNTAPPLVSGSPQQGQQLTATPGSWTGSPTPSYSYQWQRCDNSGLNCTDIASATTNSYTPQLADVGSTLLVQVTASNTAGTTGPDRLHPDKQHQPRQQRAREHGTAACQRQPPTGPAADRDPGQLDRLTHPQLQLPVAALRQQRTQLHRHRLRHHQQLHPPARRRRLDPARPGHRQQHRRHNRPDRLHPRQAASPSST